ncbi:MAG: hypothetical protein ACRELV_05375 [Longimicrobiales bacterium]
MKHSLFPALATLALAATTACSDAASEPIAVDTEALVASATAWTPSDLTRDLQVDDATREKIEAGLQALHASMVELHDRHETAQTLKGEARDAYVADLKADMQELHEQHRALWESLDPAVKEALAARLHQRMREHDGETASSLHERMRRLHGGDHGADGAGH